MTTIEEIAEEIREALTGQALGERWVERICAEAGVARLEEMERPALARWRRLLVGLPQWRREFWLESQMEKETT